MKKIIFVIILCGLAKNSFAGSVGCYAIKDKQKVSLSIGVNESDFENSKLIFADLRVNETVLTDTEILTNSHQEQVYIYRSPEIVVTSKKQNLIVYFRFGSNETILLDTKNYSVTKMKCRGD
jgi:hypothetical protein